MLFYSEKIKPKQVLSLSILIYLTSTVMKAHSIFNSLQSPFHGTPPVLSNMDKISGSQRQKMALAGFDQQP